MTTIVWKINEMACYSSQNNYSNVVYFLRWDCTATDGLKAVSFGADNILSSPTDGFTPYDQLTEDQVLGWLWASGVDKDAIEASLTQSVASMPDPVSVSLPLPWSNA